MSELHLNDLSKIYLEQIAEKKDDSYLETDMKKRQANNEKARKELAKGPQMKNPHFEETQVEEGMHRDAKTGEVVDKAEVGKTYYPNMPKKKSSVALRKEKVKEALDPVGKEDGDVNNDGKKDSSDSYLMKRRAAIAKALGKKKQTEEVENPSKDLKGAVKKAVKRIDHNVSGDVDKNDKSMGNYGEFVPSADGKKKLTTKIGEGYSNWRTDLTEVMDDIESKPIKEKSVKNKVIINPKLSEAVEEIGGQVLEVTEVQEEASMSPQEIQLQKKKAMIDKMIATKRQQGLTKAKKSEEPAKAVGEEMSIKDQMRISREANAKRKPYQPGDHQKARAAVLRNAAKKAKKDTRTDAQKMTDATGPRDAFGRPAKSGYRGD